MAMDFDMGFVVDDAPAYIGSITFGQARCTQVAGPTNIIARSMRTGNSSRFTTIFIYYLAHSRVKKWIKNNENKQQVKPDVRFCSANTMALFQH